MQSKTQFESASYYCSFLLLQTDHQDYIDKFPFTIKSANDKNHLTSLSCLVWIVKNTVVVFTSGYIIQKAILERHLGHNFSSKRIDLTNSSLSEHINFWLYYPFQNKQEDAPNNFIKLKVQSLFFSDEISHLLEKAMGDDKIAANSLGSILSLTCRNAKDLDQLLLKYSHKKRIQFAKNVPNVGHTVYTISSPYGITSPSLYRNTTRRSIVSKVLSPGVIIVDLDLRDGEQGAPVFNENMEVLGVIIGSMKPKSRFKDSQGLTVCALFFSFVNILNDLMANSYDVVPGLVNAKQHKRNRIKTASNLVVQLNVDTQCASGVIVNKLGYILTNRHVLPEAITEKTRVYGYVPFMRRVIRLEIVAFTVGDLDVALLRIPSSLAKRYSPELQLLTNEFPLRGKAYQGEDVYAIGYSFFRKEGDTLVPFITSGTLSKVVKVEKKALLLQTNCVIYNGFSGGMIADSKGNFLGLITFNLNNESKEVINNINFSYAKPVFDEIFTALEKDDEREANEEVAAKLKELELWNYQSDFVKNLHELQTVEFVPAACVRAKL